MDCFTILLWGGGGGSAGRRLEDFRWVAGMTGSGKRFAAAAAAPSACAAFRASGVGNAATQLKDRRRKEVLNEALNRIKWLV